MFRKLMQLIALLAIVVSGGGLLPQSVGAEPAEDPTARRKPKLIDDQLAEVATQVPAFGGMFVDEENGILYVYMRDHGPEVATTAEAAIMAVFDRESLPQANIQALPGQYGFLELKEWHERMMADVLGLPGVVFTDIDDAKNRLAVGVEKLEVQPLVEEQLAKLGIPREAVNIEETQPVEFAASLRDFHRPVVGGLQISFLRGADVWSCTLGFNAIRAGVSGFVTNSHCTATMFRLEGTVLYQPTIAAGNRIGVEVVDPWFFIDGKCPWSRLCRYSDSAFVRRDAGVTASQGFLARPALGSFAWNGVATFQIVGEGNPMVGQNVTKVGRTTGRTQGTVSRTCTNYNVSGTILTLLCQAKASFAEKAGDSGSPVFSIQLKRGPEPSTNVILHGIFWGSGGVFSPIGNVQRSGELGPLNTCAAPIRC